jgi:hypothetical protein
MIIDVVVKESATSRIITNEIIRQLTIFWSSALYSGELKSLYFIVGIVMRLCVG